MIQAISPPSFNALGCLDQILWKGGTPQCYNEIEKLGANRVKDGGGGARKGPDLKSSK